MNKMSSVLSIVLSFALCTATAGPLESPFASRNNRTEWKKLMKVYTKTPDSGAGSYGTCAFYFKSNSALPDDLTSQLAKNHLTPSNFQGLYTEQASKGGCKETCNKFTKNLSISNTGQKINMTCGFSSNPSEKFYPFIIDSTIKFENTQTTTTHSTQ